MASSNVLRAVTGIKSPDILKSHKTGKKMNIQRMDDKLLTDLPTIYPKWIFTQ